MFINPSIDVIKKILQETKTVAVVGLSPKPKRPSHSVSKAMQGFGYTIIPVRPAVDEVLGEKAYVDLESIPEPIQAQIDMVNVFRAPDKITPIIDACIRLKVPLIWLQDGVVNETEAIRAQAAGITVVMDRCVYRDYVQLLK
ncbi:MAG: CoA-binding protein [Gammaproteobacteria bacterium]|nr:CoA-binding protein [Gammaproteobacteria bacterium]MDH5659706.1 CoA-binding protein [Gammaproteobacteria bacterium]